MNRTSSLSTSGILTALAVAAASLSPVFGETDVESLSADLKAPVAVAELFMRSFSQKDLVTVRSLFAPEAVVSRVRFGTDGNPEPAQFAVQDWIDEARGAIAEVDNFQIELLETKMVTFDQIATVSVRFRATGSAGPHAFVNNGIDTFAMTRIQGTWRIHQYSSFETLEFD